ncbi:nuclear transport factor 2 family protein [Rhodococcus chondri]|uniref:Nuclear transport factor 2 family protein n=1 Tax=Rhodococcus chondri TaxID=3065941 RepID=A0ABU7JR92_9NOCA|nr:nuclear transport factor 2 family protein [Rhodococcus sp. CC-R104]MEE2032537.1 nuclear transport factor 2 family protein [Rhodococcus sp. CC-R104]
MTDTADQVAALLERVQILEDKAAIQEVLTAYGPAVDSGDAETVETLWAEDAVYDTDIRVMEGRDAIVEMVRTRPHQDYINEGCGHLLDPVNIRLDGDTAVVTCHSLLLRRNLDADSFRVWRVSANRFELARIEGSWKIKRRTARVLDGTAAGHDLFARASR